MKQLPEFNRGDRMSADALQMLVEAIRELQDLQPGPGLGKSGDGRLYVLPGGRATEEGQDPDYSGGTEDELDQTQGTRDTDTWKRDDDDEPVAVELVTDIKYDTVTHQLTYRTRMLHFDRGGNLIAIDAESDPITLVTTAVPLPGT